MSEGRSFADHPLVQLTLVRFREFWREPEAMFWVFVFPMLLTAGLGIAFRNKPPDVVPIGVADTDLRTQLASESSLKTDVLDRSAADEALRMGRIALYVRRDPEGSIVYRFDDTNPDARTARAMADGAVQRGAGRRAGVPVSDELVREPGSRYIDFLVPGLLGMNLMSSGIWGIGFSIVDARKKKLLKRLIASPMPRSQYLLSFLASRLVTVTVEVVTLLGFAVWVFGVPMRGPLWQAALLCLLAALAFSSLGLLVASRAKTLEAASGMINFIMLPMWICSGVFFSADRFPAGVQPAIRVLPLTAAIDALRANMLQGTTIAGLGSEVTILGLWLTVCFVTALKLFRWR